MPAIQLPLINFLTELEANNQMEWLEANRARYETEAYGPFVKLVAALLPDLQELVPQLGSNAEDAVMRMAAAGRQSLVPMIRANIAPPAMAVGKSGRTRDLPGFYLAITGTELHVGGGLFSLDRDGQTQVRNHIKANRNEFMALAQEAKFLDQFGGIQGEKLRRLGRDMDSLRMVIPEIANKEFYYVRGFRVSDHVADEGIIEMLLDHYRTIAPLNAFFTQALGGDSKAEMQFGSGYFKLQGRIDDSEE